MPRVITHITKEAELNRDAFNGYKYVVPEHEPIKLSTGSYLHILRVTKYDDQHPAGDQDVEQELVDQELYG